MAYDVNTGQWTNDTQQAQNKATAKQSQLDLGTQLATKGDWRSNVKPKNYIEPTAYNIDTTGFQNTQNLPAVMQNTGQSDQFRNNQMSFANQLQNQANGVGPSLANTQLQQGLDQNIASQMAMAGSARGGNTAMAQRNAAMNTGQLNQAAVNQAVQGRIQEQLNAQNQLGNVLNQGRGQDITIAGADQTAGMNANQLTTQANIANQNTAVQGQQLGIQNNNMQNQSMQEAYNAINGVATTQRGQNTGLASGIAGAIGTGLALFSDENLKEDITDPKKDIQDFISAIEAKKYDYKKGVLDEDTHYGVMAQDLEKTKVGKTMVKNTPRGKMVDYGQGFAAILASQGLLNDRLEKIESAFKTRSK